ncbi:hypothetical protein RF11_10411 [Thelohanellus kitauei]|uniref:Uncharacterized protein n=1 Tax=Thelohanellus kitauei TaxID=669202 RepID=A0A0C2JZN9_THEKT|nr:hypothetical protein RF11_10411 [Thelohanellus kitauei]
MPECTTPCDETMVNPLIVSIILALFSLYIGTIGLRFVPTLDQACVLITWKLNGLLSMYDVIISKVSAVCLIPPYIFDPFQCDMIVIPTLRNRSCNLPEKV